MSAGLTNGEVIQVVNRYIGVSGGYLGDFSYRTHAEFYPGYCDLDIDPSEYEGTTRERFIAILSSRAPRQQARILRGILERFPAEPGFGPPARGRMKPKIVAMIERLSSVDVTLAVEEGFSAQVVRDALADAEVLVRERSPTSAVDRVHTALHGYLRDECRRAGIAHDESASSGALLKALRREHPQLSDLGPRSNDIAKVLNSAAAIIDALGPLRNKTSMAHPNEDLLEPEEATLVINVARSLIGYLADKLDAKSIVEAVSEAGPSEQLDVPF